MTDVMYPKDLIEAIQNELDATVDDMLNDPANYGLPETLNRDSGDERLEDQDILWIKRAIAHRWAANDC